MKREEGCVVFAPMTAKEKRAWDDTAARHVRSTHKKRQLRNISISAAAVLCLSVLAGSMLQRGDVAEAVMSHVTAEFDYDETLGRLQFVSNILPESAMVFLESKDATEICAPTMAEVTHVWSQEEPWLEYACMGGVKACSDGEVMTVVKNREDEYTVRLSHENGYESVYSGLTNVQLSENDRVLGGEQLGAANGFAAFELRKDGLSVLPVFGEQ